MLRPLVIGLLASVFVAVVSSSAQAQYSEASVQQAKALAERSRLRLQPRVISYDPETDSFEYQSSVATASGNDRPGGESIYYGNRLHRFRFLGPAEQGGLYETLQWYYERLNIDPRNYQYRMGQY